MRTVLYITPYFPPASKVGALRPLKFVRHFAEHGIRPIVLADLRPGDATQRSLWEALPEGTDVRFAYSASAGRTFRKALSGKPMEASEPPRAKPARRWPGPSIPGWFKWSPEYMPLGEHSPQIPGAIVAANRIVANERVDAILVNADPYAAMLVGAHVGAKHGIPVVHDLRDPWSVCDLRRPRRPAAQRRAVDAMERSVVEKAARMVLNTETTRDAYLAHYPDIPAERFTVVRNHGDDGLIGSHVATRDADAPFTVLFLGNFRRFLEGDALLGGLAALRERGEAANVRFAVTGNVTAAFRERAAALGVASMIEERPYVPYDAIGQTMDGADLLIANIPSTMRVPAKFYDYAMSRRPILALGPANHQELRELVERVPGATFAPSDAAAAVADAIVTAFERGRGVAVDRSGTGLDSDTATARMSEALYAAMGARRD